jgi:hypothetical protein
MKALSIDRVMEAVDRLLVQPRCTGSAPAPLRVVDLRRGASRYEVWESPRPAAADPATYPLAHAH